VEPSAKKKRIENICLSPVFFYPFLENWGVLVLTACMLNPIFRTHLSGSMTKLAQMAIALATAAPGVAAASEVERLWSDQTIDQQGARVGSPIQSRHPPLVSGQHLELISV
jgi:hypothetical protein